MPFYDYVCQACGRRIEVMHGVHATGPGRCDACGGRMQRVISRPAIHFKGSGWAKMDARVHSATGGRGQESNGTSSSEDAPAAGGSTKDETPAKPALSDSGTDTAKPDTAKPARAGHRSAAPSDDRDEG